MNKFLTAVCAVALSFAATGCASTQNADGGAADAAEISDPLEGVNRGVFAFNDAVDRAVGRPIAQGYRAVVPKPARTGVRNFLSNLRSPIVLANNVLQGDVEGSGKTLLRAVVNTTVGVGGLFDVAGHEGVKDDPEDFGQTLAVWGAGHGPYLVLPLLGPSSVRDATGMMVDSYADPLRLYLYNTDNEGWHYARIGATYVDKREELLDVLDDLRKNSFDYYAALRSVYVQRREALVHDQNPDETAAPSIPDYDSAAN